MTGRRPYIELLDDVEHAFSDELDGLLKVYHSIDRVEIMLVSVRILW